jgi:hypothetical protein
MTSEPSSTVVYSGGWLAAKISKENRSRYRRNTCRCASCSSQSRNRFTFPMHLSWFHLKREEVMTCRCSKGSSVTVLSSNASNRDTGLISKLSSALSVLGEANSLHNEKDRGFVAKETEQQKKGREDETRTVLHRFITPCASRWVKTKPGIDCSVRRKVRMCPRVCVA